MNRIARSRPNQSRRINLSSSTELSVGDEKIGPWPALSNLSYRINFIHRLLDRQTKQFLSAHFDMTTAEWYVLGYLAWHSPCTIATISGETAIYKSQVSHAVTVLVEKGLVLRTDDPADKRSPRFRISARGQRVQKKVSKWAVERQQELVEQLAPHQYAVLDGALDILAGYIKATA